ncbi:protease [Neisseria sp. HMSC071C03]|jgi:signal peptide peptidase sppA|uniref:Protease n=1 Tax=Morococcus cerebrosus TaxID=1056807 RepID=A0A0C1EIA1_9NEIS|nr:MULTISPECIES: S49 family peptidase [Neisseriaceae]OFJ68133.1 protease [Neisseria sp. HMSC073B07]OHR41234.1 protease [Neisseria sp. HMSC071B12]OHR47108.1 protease [Neisseria sp. HMSC071C03]KIC08523.1 protease [Morococcus cerebrosus]UNV87488.1 S49 family peptidase [Morococcus cerebrosus]
MQETNGYPDKRPDGPEGRWERDVLRDVLLAAYKEQRRARFWRNFWRVIGVLLFATLWFGSDDGTAGQGLAAGKEHTAVITLEGEIGGGMDDQVKMLRDSMEAAYSNPNAKGIVIRANSLGGSPVISNTAFNEIRRLKSEHKNIPVYVVAEDMCASGCYYIAAAADKIYANPSSIVGSIGVIGGGFDVTGLMEKLGIKRRLKTAGSNKGMGDPFTPETPEQGKIWEGILSDTHQEFIKAVKLGRGEKLKDKEYPDVFSGRIYVGLEAKKVGLIDDFGSVYSIARDVVKAPELVSYMPEDDFRKILSRRFGAQVKAEVEKTLSKMW